MGAVAFIDIKARLAALDYFKMIPEEPVLTKGTIQIKTVLKYHGITTEKLLIDIDTKVKAGGDILVVSHGTNNGLSLALIANSKAFLQTNAIDVLKENEEGKITD